MSEERRQSLKLWEPGSFDAHKNAAAPMIAMLGHPELDTEVLDAGMETAESDDCRTVRRGSHRGGSPQNVLGDERTCGTTLASAYVLRRLSAA